MTRPATGPGAPVLGTLLLRPVRSVPLRPQGNLSTNSRQAEVHCEARWDSGGERQDQPVLRTIEKQTGYRKGRKPTSDTHLISVPVTAFPRSRMAPAVLVAADVRVKVAPSKAPGFPASC